MAKDFTIRMIIDPKEKARLNFVIDALRSLSWVKPVLKKSAFLMLDSIKMNFERQGRPQKWASWSKRYKAWRDRTGAQGNILVLYAKYTPEFGRSRANAKKRGKIKTRSYNAELMKSILDTSKSLSLGARSWNIGTNVKYAATHQFGDPSRRIPARPFFLFQDIDVLKIGKMIETVINGIFNGKISAAIDVSKVM